MTADLSSAEFLALAERELLGQVHIQSAMPLKTGYLVIYEHTTFNPNGTPSAVCPVLGSVSQEGGAVRRQESVPESNQENDAGDDDGGYLPTETKRPVETGIHSPSGDVAEQRSVAGRSDADATGSGAEGNPDHRSEDASDTGELRRNANMGGRRQEGISEPQIKVVRVACPSCGTMNHENEPCQICEALSCLRTVCDQKRKAYHAFKSGQRQDASFCDAESGSRGD